MMLIPFYLLFFPEVKVAVENSGAGSDIPAGVNANPGSDNVGPRNNNADPKGENVAPQ